MLYVIGLIIQFNKQNRHHWARKYQHGLKTKCTRLFQVQESQCVSIGA